MLRYSVPAPRTERELMGNSARIAGQSLGQIARASGIQVPATQKYAKGWIGELIEISLGATAASLPEPDFQHIGVELKTLPVNKNGRPKESTYICTVPLTATTGLKWSNSTVKKKLERVLWVPVEADPSIVIFNRRIGNPFIWSPEYEQWAALQADWEEFMEYISLGRLDRIDSRHGKVLQIRPKAANSRVRVKMPTATGETGLTLPRGFYLRTGFTGEILKTSLKFRV